MPREGAWVHESMGGPHSSETQSTVRKQRPSGDVYPLAFLDHVILIDLAWNILFCS